MKYPVTCSAILLLLQDAAAFTFLQTQSHSTTSRQLTRQPHSTTSPLFASSTPSLLQNGTHASDGQHSSQIDHNQEKMKKWADAISFAPTDRLAVQTATFIEQHHHEDNLVSFNTVLKGWVRCSYRLTELRQNYMVHKGDAASRNVNWDEIEASGVDNAFSVYTPRDAVEHANALLENNVHNIELDAHSFNIIMDGWSKLKKTPDAVEKIEKLLRKTPQADIFAYNSLIEAHSISSSEEALENVLKVFNKLPMKPNSHTINSVLHAYSVKAASDYRLAKECAIAAEKLLDEASKSQKADVISYTAVMECWSRVNGGADNAEGILERFKATIKPSIYTYNVLMQSYRRPPNVEKATKLLNQLLEATEETKKWQDVKANAVLCTTYLTVLGKSRTESQAVEALRLIQRMNKLSAVHPAISPLLVTYNAALEVCAQVPEDKGNSQLVALKIAFALLKSLEQHETLKPNHVTYSTLLKAVTWLLPTGSQERDQVARALFEKAKANGQVDTFCLKNLQRACSAALYAEVMTEIKEGAHFSSDSPIPMSWSRNVRL